MPLQCSHCGQQSAAALHCSVCSACAVLCALRANCRTQCITRRQPALSTGPLLGQPAGWREVGARRSQSAAVCPPLKSISPNIMAHIARPSRSTGCGRSALCNCGLQSAPLERRRSLAQRESRRAGEATALCARMTLASVCELAPKRRFNYSPLLARRQSEAELFSHLLEWALPRSAPQRPQNTLKRGRKGASKSQAESPSSAAVSFASSASGRLLGDS